jgi:hypothetical protein
VVTDTDWHWFSSNPHFSPDSTGTRILTVPICPDLLDHAALGAADNLRGHVVRAFFWLLRAWPP